MYQTHAVFVLLAGSVITYDIITGWKPIQLYDQFVTSIIVSALSTSMVLGVWQIADSALLCVRFTSHALAPHCSSVGRILYSVKLVRQQV